MRKIEVRIRLCPYERCLEYYDAVTGQFLCGKGPVDCDCQLEVK